jgi:cyclopropane fatty-acyl-phospholipid synthase-like methyltransferase
MTGVETIRSKEKKNHERFYENNVLFQEGTWLHNPVASVMNYMHYLDLSKNIKILDLGCGVGRNSIPMAKLLRHSESKVICVDILEKAIIQLDEYSHKYGVRNKIDCIHQSIEDYKIKENYFDYIVSVSALEHVSSVNLLMDKLIEIQKATKIGGMVCLIFNTSIEEIDKSTGKSINPQFEINLSKDEMEEILNKVFGQWAIMQKSSNNYQFNIHRFDLEVILKSDCMTFVAQKNGKSSTIDSQE